MLATRLHGTRQTRKGARRLSGPTRAALAIVLTLMAMPAGPLSPTARAATPRYASVGGTDSGDCSASPCRTIGYALSQAVDGDTIGVADGLYRENLTVSKSVTLQGAGAGATIIDGSAIATVIAVNSGATVTIEGVTIQGGSGSGPYGSISSTAGGGVFNAGTLTLTNSAVTGNVAQAGGGVFNDGAATITDSMVSGNRSAGLGGGGVDNRGTLTLSNSTVTGNRSSKFGGGVYNGGTATLTSATINGNNATGGGAVFNGGMMTLTDSILSGNGADGGAGLFNNGGTLALTNTTLSNNGYAFKGGGGLFNDLGGTVTLTGSTLSGNSGAQGGGVYNNGIATLANTTLSGNNGAQGGAAYNAYGRTFTVVNSAISGNSASTDGGGIYNYVGTLMATGSTFSGNSGPDGGALYNDYGTATLTNSTVSGNSAANSGGGIRNGYAGSLTLTSSTLSGNGSSSGGGLYNYDAATATLTNTIIASGTGGNCANAGSGAITSGGHNLATDNTCKLTPASDLPNTDPQLGPLADNGGPTPTHALQPGSPAIEAGTCADSAGNPITTDQRGIARPQGGACDIGAYEYVPPAPVPAVSLSPTSLSFGDQQVGTTSVTRPVTLTNTGTAPLSIGGIAANGDFARTATCGGTLAAQASCTIGVTFTPTATGARSGTLTIDDNAPGSPHTVALDGSGIAAAVSLRPTSLDLAGQPVGTISAPQSVTLTNTGSAALTITAVGLGGANPDDFLKSSDSCSGVTLAPNGSCTVGVRFAPSASGARSANLTFSDNAAGSPQTVPLSSAGTPPPPIPGGLQYYPLPRPVRLLDTRPGQPACDNPGAPLAGGSRRAEGLRPACTGVPANARAVVGNATVVNPPSGGAGYVTLYPSDTGQPNASTLNYAPGQIVPNAFTVGLGGDGAFAIYASGAIDFVVDVTGYYAPPGAGGLYYHPLASPIRLLDTRAGQPACDTPGAPLTGNSRRVEPARLNCGGSTIPTSARAIVGNATVVNPPSGGSGYVTLWPSSTGQPAVSNLNYVPGQTVANAVTVGLGDDGAFDLYAYTTLDLIVDVSGYYSAEARDANGLGLTYTSLARPVRLLDTRGGQAACDTPATLLAGGRVRSEPARVDCAAVPAAARAVVGNATVVNPSNGGYGYVTLWPNGATQPTVSNLNYGPGQVVPNAFTVGLDADGAFAIYAYSSLDIIVDLTGYFAP